MEVARVVAQRSLCARAQVGAVIVDASNRIVATGYNGPPAEYYPTNNDGHRRFMAKSCSTGPGTLCQRGLVGPTSETLKSYEDCPTIHAELNALMFCDRREREGGALYVTGAVCFTCAKAVANSGLTRVWVGAEPEDRSHRDPDISYQLLEDSGVRVGFLP